MQFLNPVLVQLDIVLMALWCSSLFCYCCFGDEFCDAVIRFLQKDDDDDDDSHGGKLQRVYIRLRGTKIDR